MNKCKRNIQMKKSSWHGSRKKWKCQAPLLPPPALQKVLNVSFSDVQDLQRGELTNESILHAERFVGEHNFEGYDVKHFIDGVISANNSNELDNSWFEV